VMYTEMVARRGYSLSQYVDLVSTNAARIMGLYPRKGAIAPGSDADITILDPTRRGKVRAADLHETDYTPWEGHDIFAWPVITILRGKIMVEDGHYHASAGDGRYLKRKIPVEIRNGPAI
jgi:dihydropyrimidinase